MTLLRVATRRSSVIVALALALATAIPVGCAPAATGDPTAADGLYVLAPDADGAARLTLWTGALGTDAMRDVALPAAATAWVSSGRARVLAATLLDGSLLTSDPVDADGTADLAWRPVEARDLAGNAPQGPAWFVTWDPQGGRFATITGDLPGGADVALTLIDPTTSSAFVLPLGRPLLPSAPVWLDGDRVALVGGTTAEPRAIVVDSATGEIEAGPAGDRRLATSADASVITATGGPGSAVVVHATTSWRSGGGDPMATIDAPDGDAQATAMALDPKGQRLAIVWQGGPDGLRLDIHTRATGWRRATTVEGVGTAAAIAWSR